MTPSRQMAAISNSLPLARAQAEKPKVALHPKHPERICWGCDKYCSAGDLRCGNGTIRTPHPAELFGDNWDDISKG